MTEREYRQLKIDSYSTLKTFAEDRKKYYKKYIAEDTQIDNEEPDTKATIIGSLVDCLLLNPDEFDNKFHISSCTETPTGLMLEFVEALYKRTRSSVDENGRLTREFGAIMLDAYNDVKFDKDGNVVAFKRDSFEKVVEKFNGNTKNYYDDMCRVRPNNITVITPSDIEQAEKVVKELKTCPFTSQVINLQSNERFEVANQVALRFSFKGMEFKSLIDKVIIDHEEETTQPLDLKVTWDTENFYENYYLYRKSYIQAGLYHLALISNRTEKVAKYKVLPMRFITVDPNGYMSPLIYTLSESKLLDSYNGFTHKWKKYEGIEKLIDDLKWHKENGIWNISKKNYENQGIVNINEEIDG